MVSLMMSDVRDKNDRKQKEKLPLFADCFISVMADRIGVV